MIYIRRILIISIITFLNNEVFSQEERIANHRITINSSWITIHGKTNINTFHCSLNRSNESNKIAVKNVWSNKQLTFDGFTLNYKIEDFECGFKAMNNDFQELLRSNDDPYLTLQINSITLKPENTAFEELNVQAIVEVTIAGIRKKVEVTNGKVFNHTPAYLTLSGNKKLLMSDFSIDPPTKFLGMVKVSDEITIEFEISMEVSALE